MILQTRFTVYGNGITIICNWFKRFRAGNFELKDEDHSDRLAAILSMAMLSWQSIQGHGC